MCILWVLPMTVANAIEDRSMWCEHQWLILSAEFADREKADYPRLLSAWKELDSTCRGTVSYEARMALIYYYLDQIDGAKAAIKSVRDTKSDYTYLVELVSTLLDLKELTDAGKVNQTDLQKIDNEIYSYVKAYPDKPEGYALFGMVESQLGRHDAAIKLYEESLKKLPKTNQQWGVYRNMTISFTEVARYEESYHAAGKAISLHKTVTNDRYFMYALAKAEAGIGQLDDARITLKLISTKQPDVFKDPEFLAAVNFVVGIAKKTNSE
jgi:tetratricopeptide (TPR) repeat protein